MRVITDWHAMGHFDFSTMLACRKRMVSRLGMRSRMGMAQSGVTDLNRTRMGMDERRHRLQDDNNAEHQVTDHSVWHSQGRQVRLA